MDIKEKQRKRKKQKSTRVKEKSRTAKIISMKRSMRYKWKYLLKKRPINYVIRLKTYKYNNVYMSP